MPPKSEKPPKRQAIRGVGFLSEDKFGRSKLERNRLMLVPEPLANDLEERGTIRPAGADQPPPPHEVRLVGIPSAEAVGGVKVSIELPADEYSRLVSERDSAHAENKALRDHLVGEALKGADPGGEPAATETIKRGRSTRDAERIKRDTAEARNLRAQGLTYDEIADRLSVSTDTVRRYLGKKGPR